MADRGNDRLLLLNDAGQVVWTYPSAHAPAPPGRFLLPRRRLLRSPRHAIISNQEENETIVDARLSLRPVAVVLRSPPRRRSSAPGYLNNPDDAYLLKNGDITVADPMNCRVLVISPQKRVMSQIGTTGACVHNPPTELGSPNGDTPLANGDFLISEINGSWVDEYTPKGRLVWDVRAPYRLPVRPPTRSGPAPTSSPTTRTPERSSSSTARAASSTATSPPRAPGCSTGRRSSSCCRRGCSC